jgi:hypothetical protein
MRWEKEGGCLEHENWLLQPIEEWSQFWQSCNWYTFHPIKIEIENDASLGGIEATIIILGVGLRWRWNHTETELGRKIADDITAIRNGSLETFPVNLPGDR